MSDEFNVDDIEQEEQVTPDEKFEAKEIEINYWRTPLHGEKIGIKREAVRASQSRQYTKELDVVGDITFREKKERKEVIGFNIAFFDLEDDSPLVRKYGTDADRNRRIVIKTFTELTDKGGGRWTGTIEQSLTESLVLSSGERDPLPSFIVNVPGYDYLTRVVRSHTMTGARYVFPLIKEGTNETRVFEMSLARVALGTDFKVVEVGTGQKVAEIDGKVLDIGGKWHIKIKDEALYSDNVFRRIIILFASAVKYLPEANESLKKLLNGVKKGYTFIPTGNELSVFYNPRRFRR